MKTVPTGICGAWLLAWVCLLSACGGGGGASGSGPGDPPHEAPPPSSSSAPPAPAPSPPPERAIAPLEAPALRLTPTAIKTLRFDWSGATGATGFQLLEDPDGASGYSAIADLPADATGYEQVVFLPARLNARYTLRACRANGDCADSPPVAVAGQLAAAVGYAKPASEALATTFGSSVALSSRGDFLAVGAPNESVQAPAGGAVYVFAREAAGWRLHSRLQAPDVGNHGYFGAAVAWSADATVLAVGAYRQGRDRSGAVYVYQRQDDHWAAPSVLKPLQSTVLTPLPASLALSANGRRLAVGAYEDSTRQLNSGAVHVFEESGGVWRATAFVKAPVPTPEDRFGEALALSGDGLTLAVGTSAHDGTDPNLPGVPLSNSGAVYLFALSQGAWRHTASLTAPAARANDRFGLSVALSAKGDRLAVGACFDDAQVIDSGAVHVFARQNLVWSAEAKLKAAYPTRYARFGYRVALSESGDTLAVGTPFDDTLPTGPGPAPSPMGPTSGTAYVFQRGAQQWQAQAQLKARNPSDKGQFGMALALAGDGQTLAVGAVGEASAGSGIGAAPDADDGSAPNRGAVYLY